MLITRSGINCPKGNNAIQYRLSKQLGQLELEAPEANNAPTGYASFSTSVALTAFGQTSRFARQS